VPAPVTLPELPGAVGQEERPMRPS
jgi:hypothetical protein